MRHLRLDDHLCFSLYAAHRAMTAAYASVLDPLDLTYPQYLVLVALGERDDVPVKALGERLRLDSGTLTPMLQRMDRAGLVTRARDPEDERRVRVRLTDVGRERLEAALAAAAGMLCTSSLDLGALPGLRDALWDLVRGLEAGSTSCAALAEP
jgi:DNA-binding MarR family transcriptional regulator